MLHVLGGGGSTMQRQQRKITKNMRSEEGQPSHPAAAGKDHTGNTVFTSSFVKIHTRKVPGTFDGERIKPCEAQRDD